MTFLFGCVAVTVDDIDDDLDSIDGVKNISPPMLESHQLNQALKGNQRLPVTVFGVLYIMFSEYNSIGRKIILTFNVLFQLGY